MEIFSTAAKLLVRRLRLRVQKAQSPHYWQRCGKTLKSVNQYKYVGAVLSTEHWALRWQKHSETTAIKILCSKQAVSLFFPMFKCSKNVLFRSFCTPIYASQIWWIFRKSCMQTLPVVYDFGCRALYNLPWRASVSSYDSSGSMQHSYIWGIIKKK